MQLTQSTNSKSGWDIRQVKFYIFFLAVYSYFLKGQD